MRGCSLLILFALGAGCCPGPSTKRYSLVLPKQPRDLHIDAPPAEPSRVVVHLAVDTAPLVDEVDRFVPGRQAIRRDCKLAHLRDFVSQCSYGFHRDPIKIVAIETAAGGGVSARITATVHLDFDLQLQAGDKGPIGALLSEVGAALPVGKHLLPLLLKELASHPPRVHSTDVAVTVVMTALPTFDTDYRIHLKSPQVESVTIDQTTSAGARFVAELQVAPDLAASLRDVLVDLRPALDAAYARVAGVAPIPGSTACATLDVDRIEAGPLVADGSALKEDFAFTIRPSVVLPCPARAAPGTPAFALPPIVHVPSVPALPSRLIVPVAAAYQQLTSAMAAGFTDDKAAIDGQPDLKLSNPTVFATIDEQEKDPAKQRKLVMRFDLDGDAAGPSGIKIQIDAGRIFLIGTPSIDGDKVTLPDLALSADTRSILVNFFMSVQSTSLVATTRAKLEGTLNDQLRDARKNLLAGFNRGGVCVTDAVSDLKLADFQVHPFYLSFKLETAGGSVDVKYPCKPAPVSPPGPPSPPR